MILNAKDGLRVCQLQIARSITWLQLTCHVTLTRSTLAKGLLSWDISIFSRFTRRGRSHLDSQLTIISIWLHPVTFRWIKNLGSPTPKYNEFLASHCCDLRSKGHLCPYLLGTSLDSRVFQIGSCSVRMYFYISLVYHTSISILLGKRGQLTNMAHDDLILI